jgi:hypothetical protein
LRPGSECRHVGSRAAGQNPSVWRRTCVIGDWGGFDRARRGTCNKGARGP